MLKFPYAVRDFYKLITEGHIYMDRTDRIPVMEDLGYELLFLRPRRFGKSLWLSTLMNYYDLAQADQFERLFGHLAVGQNPTPLHNQYLVMKWDFSMVESQGDIHDIRKSLYSNINGQIKNFQRVYKSHLNDIVETQDDALASLISLFSAVKASGHKLYLFIDEYDNFANEVMMGQQDQNRKRYNDLVSGEGLLKTLFKNIKAAGSGAGLDRVFMTGVSPIVMNDMTSGANVNEDITWIPYLNDLCGFREDELRTLAQRMVEEGQLDLTKVEEVLEQMRIFYNGSCFITHNPVDQGKNTSLIYNPTLTFYFLRHIQRFGYYPDNMLDSNLAPDYNKLVYISGYSKGEQLLLDALDEQRPVTVSSLDDRWGVQEMLDPEQQRERLASLLCYLGALTVGGKQSDAKIILQIPNLVMRKLYAERILAMTFRTADDRDEAKVAADTLFAQGNIAPLCNFVEKHLLTVYDNRDYKTFNELTLKTLFIALLHYNNLYMMDSEPAIQRGYGDLIMIIRPEMRHYSVFDLLIEFKFVSLSKLGKFSQQEIREKSHSELVNLAAVKTAFQDAQAQLQSYRQTLEQKYGDILKLQTYAVIAVSFERMLWEEMA